MKCEIIKDLIPLSAEGLCSEESEREISEHIKDCENCCLLYEKVPEKDESISIPDEKETFRKVNRKFIKLSAKSGVLIAILIVVLTVLGWLTYNQITKGGSMISFETIFQSMEVKKIAEDIANGDFESYVDSISIAYDTGIRYINRDELRIKDTELLNEAFRNAYGDTKVKDIRVDSAYSRSFYNDEDSWVVENNATITFENEKEFCMTFMKSTDGKYIADMSYLSSSTDMTDEELAFSNAVNFANYHDMSPYGMVEKLIMKNKIIEDSHAWSIYANRFHKEYREQVETGKRNINVKGYNIKNAYFSTSRYDVDKDLFYYDVTIIAEDNKGTATLTTSLYYDYMGLYPPEKDSMNISENGCTSGLTDALYNFFG